MKAIHPHVAHILTLCSGILAKTMSLTCFM